MIVMFELDGSRIDFPALRAQKATLLMVGNESPSGSERQKHVDGLVAFLDYVQDQAAEVFGEKAVFGDLPQE